MSWIKTINTEEASGLLAKLYRQIADQRGQVAEILKIHSLLPDTMAAHLNLYRSIVLSNKDLSRRQREMIAVTVSKLNKCSY